jgi:hypothetical protein
MAQVEYISEHSIPTGPDDIFRPTTMSSEQKTQQAWIVERKGQPKDVIRKKEWPIPSKLGPGEVLVKVQAAALNPVYVCRSKISI